MIIFAGSDYFKRFLDGFAVGPDTRIGQFSADRYMNGELHLKVETDVDGQNCTVIGTIAPPDNQLFEFLTLCATLKRSGATSVNAFLPYLAYGRQDKFDVGESGGIALIGKLLSVAGVDRVITFDTHSSLDEGLLGLPLESITSVVEFAPLVSELGWQDASVVVPDEGALARGEALLKAVNIKSLVKLTKQRTDGISHLEIAGSPQKRCIIIDDILDTGYTLISACKFLRERGVEKFAIVVTHGLFHGDAWKELFDLGVETLYVTDSCPDALLQNDKRIRVVSLLKTVQSKILTLR